MYTQSIVQPIISAMKGDYSFVLQYSRLNFPSLLPFESRQECGMRTCRTINSLLSSFTVKTFSFAQCVYYMAPRIPHSLRLHTTSQQLEKCMEFDQVYNHRNSATFRAQRVDFIAIHTLSQAYGMMGSSHDH